MNRKLLILIVIFLIIAIFTTVFVLVNNKENNIENNHLNENQNNIKDEENAIISSNDKKSLVLYFSATGSTKKVAEFIQEITNSDIIQIVPKEKYTNDDLNYNNNSSRANKEQQNNSSRPEIEDIPSIDKYNIIYLGYPIWHGDVPKVILTTLDKYEFNSKDVYLFCTSASTGIEKSVNTLKSYNENIKWLGSKRFSSLASKEDVEKWISDLRLDEEDIIVQKEENKMYIKVNGSLLNATLENNSSAVELVNKLKQGDIKVDMSDYANFEKVGDLGFSISRNDEDLSTDYGDLILYEGDKFVIYYDKNNWNFTKLGHIEGVTKEELKRILGTGDVTVTLSLNNE